MAPLGVGTTTSLIALRGKLERLYGVDMADTLIVFGLSVMPGIGKSCLIDIGHFSEN